MIRKNSMLYPEKGDKLGDRILYIIWSKTFLGSSMSEYLTEKIMEEVGKEYGQTSNTK